MMARSLLHLPCEVSAYFVECGRKDERLRREVYKHPGNIHTM